MVSSAGLLVLRDVGRDSVDDVFLLPARKLWDTIEDLTHLAGWSAVTLGHFPARRLSRLDNQQVFDADAQGLSHLWQHI